MLKRLHKIFAVLSVFVIAAFMIQSHPIAATRPIAFVPTGSGFVKVSSGTEQSTASAVTLSGSDVTGTLPVGNGGTGASSLSSGIIKSNGTVLSSGQVDLTTNVTSTLPVGNGGTGTTSLTANNVILGNGASAVSFVAPGTSGNLLTSNGTTWTSAVRAADTSIGVYASRPAVGTAGHRYITTDGYTEFVDDGSLWRPMIFGRLGYEPPSVSGWTTYSHGGISGAQVPVNSVGAIINQFNNYNSGAEEMRVTTHAMPGGAYTLTAFIRPLQSSAGVLIFGLTFRQSSNGSVENYGVEQAGSTLTLNRHRATASSTGTGPTYTFNADTQNTTVFTNTGLAGISGIWLRITDDRAGTRQCYFSIDGVTFFEALTIKVTGNTFITADEAGITSWGSGVSPGGGYIGAIYYSLKEN